MEEKSDAFVVAVGIGIGIVILIVVVLGMFWGTSSRQVAAPVQAQAVQVRAVRLSAPPDAAVVESPQPATSSSATGPGSPAKAESEAPEQPTPNK